MPLTFPDFLGSRLNLPVAVLGAGVSGQGAVSLLTHLGASTVPYDQAGEEFTLATARRHGLVVFSPGFSLHHPWLEMARKSGCICMAEMDFASLFWRGRIVAITGTNGKTTLTEFIAHALTVAGRRAFAAGNIGLPLSRLVADLDGGETAFTAVCETSSFQAEQLGHLVAQGLLWTNFAEDHLERHARMEDYFTAKWELVLRTNPARFFAGTSVTRHGALYGRTIPPASAVATEGQPADPLLAETVFARYPQRENFLLAAAWWRSEGLDENLLYRAAASFRIGRHRLAPVSTVEGVRFWNDSKATNFHAVEAALASFARPVVLIAGGRSKGGDLPGFVRRIAPMVAHAVLLGETAPALAAVFETEGVGQTTASSMEAAVRAAAVHAPAGGEVLLSPGFASFDMFRGYEDRGDRFEQAVRELHSVRV